MYINLRLLVSIMLVALGTSVLKAQDINVHFNDGTELSFTLEDVQKITFEADVMFLHLTDGDLYSWDVNTINFYEYVGVVSHLEETQRQVDHFDIELFPNPARGMVNLRFQVLTEDNLVMFLSDMSGKVLLQKRLGVLAQGEYLETIDLSLLSKGNYLCRMLGKKSSSVKKLIVE